MDRNDSLIRSAEYSEQMYFLLLSAITDVQHCTTVKLSFKEVGGEDEKASNETVVTEPEPDRDVIQEIKVVYGGAGSDGVSGPGKIVVGDIIQANIHLSDDRWIYSYPPVVGISYKWHYQDSDIVLGTDSSYTVTADNVGKVLCVTITVEDVPGVEDTEITWTPMGVLPSNDEDEEEAAPAKKEYVFDEELSLELQDLLALGVAVWWHGNVGC